MDTSKSKRGKKYIKKIIYIFLGAFTAFVLLINLVFYWGIPKALQSYGISFSQYYFDFPQRLKLDDFSYQSEQFWLKGQEFSLAWSWNKLLRGQLQILDVKAKAIEVIYKQAEEVPEPVTDTIDNDFSLPHFQISDLEVQNLLVYYINLGDTNTFLLYTLTINDLISSEKIFLDTLILSSQNKYIYRESTDPETDTTPFQNLNFIPSFEINYLSVFNTGFHLENADQYHNFSDINLQLSGIKNNDWLDLELNDFRFKYQDTLDINLTLDSATMQNNLNTRIAALSFALPGLQLNFNHTIFSNQPAVQLSTTLQNSYVATSWLKFFWPDYALYIPDSKIYFQGNLQYQDNRILLNNLTFITLNNTSLGLSGNLGQVDDKTSLDLLSELNSPIADIKKFYKDFNYESLNFKNANLKIQIRGNSDFLDLKGNLKLDDNTFNMTGNIENEKSNFNYKASIWAENIWLSQISSAVLDSSYIGSLEIMAWGNHSSLPNIKLLTSDIFFAGQAIDQVSARFLAGASGIDSLKLDLIRQESSLTLSGAYQKNSLPQLKFQGKINLWFKPLLRPEKSSVQFSSGIEGFASWKDVFYEGNLNFFNAQLNSDNLIFYLEPAAINLELNDNLLQAEISENDKPFLEALADLDIPSFAVDDIYDQNIAQYLPLAEIQGAYQMDEQLFRLITGETGGFAINFFFNNDQQLAVAEIDISEIRIGENQLEDIQLSFEINDNIRSQLTANELNYAGQRLDNLQLQLKKQKKLYQLLLKFTTNQERFLFNFALEATSDKDEFNIGFSRDEPLILAGVEWQKNVNQVLKLDRKLQTLQGGIEIFHQSEAIRFSTQPNQFQLSIDSLNLHPLLVFINPDSLNIGGKLNFTAEYDLLHNNLTSKGELFNLSVDSIQLNPVLFEARKEGEVVAASLNMGENLTANFNYDQEVDFSLLLDRFDIGSLNQFPLVKDYWQSRGYVSVDLSGSYAEKLNLSGVINFDDAEINIPGYVKQIKIEDTLVFTENGIQFYNFTVSNNANENLFLNGNVSFDPLFYEITAKTGRFSLTDILDYQPVDGNLQVTCDLKFERNAMQTIYDGSLEVLPNAYLEYTYSGMYSFENASETVQFISFDELDQQPEKQFKTSKTDPINWNVDLKIGNATFYLIYNPVSQEFVSITGTGNLNLRNGPSKIPYLYGSFVSNKGEAFYVPPMIPDLNIELKKTEVAWNGEPYQPVITLEGVKSVKAPTKGLGSRFDKRTSLAPFDIKVIIDQKKIEDMDLIFDLASSDTEIQPYLQSMHPDTRQAYALNLLLFGTFELEFADGGSAYMNFLASKLNEISRRNLKNASLSFSIDDTSLESESDEDKLNRLNYSFSKGFLNNKLQVTVGGNIILSDKAVSNSDLATPLGSIEFNYVLNEQPYWGIRGEKSTEYEGIIDGNVGKTSLGLKFQKSYPTFWHFLKIGKRKDNNENR